MTMLVKFLRSYLLFGRAPRSAVVGVPQAHSQTEDQTNRADNEDDRDERSELSLLFDIIRHM
jgi:hypothetical protein